MHPLKSFKQEVSLAVEYTANGKRVQKTFTNAYRARQFYTAKSKAVASPKLIHLSKEQAMSDAITTPTVATPKTPKTPKAKATRAAKASSNGAANGTHREIPDQKTKTIRWTERKIALVKALQKLGATNKSSARTPKEVAAASKGQLDEGQVNHQVNPAFDLMQQAMIGRADLEEQGRSYYVTAKAIKAVEKAEKAAQEAAAQ